MALLSLNLLSFPSIHLFATTYYLWFPRGREADRRDEGWWRWGLLRCWWGIRGSEKDAAPSYPFCAQTHSCTLISCSLSAQSCTLHLTRFTSHSHHFCSAATYSTEGFWKQTFLSHGSSATPLNIQEEREIVHTSKRECWGGKYKDMIWILFGKKKTKFVIFPPSHSQLLIFTFIIHWKMVLCLKPAC